MRWTALVLVGACNGKGGDGDTGAAPPVVDETVTTAETDEPVVATADDPYILAYAGCTATFTTTKGEKVVATGTYVYDGNGDRVREVIDGKQGQSEIILEYGYPHEASRVVTGTSVTTYTWTDGHITLSERDGEGDGIVDSVTEWGFEGDFLSSEYSHGLSGWWQRTTFNWTHSGSDHTAEWTDSTLEYTGNGTAIADDAGNILEQVGTASTTLEMQLHQTAPNAIGERTHSDRADFNFSVSYTVTRDWTLDALGRVLVEQVVDVEQDQGDQPKETVTVTEYTYDCP